MSIYWRFAGAVKRGPVLGDWKLIGAVGDDPPVRCFFRGGHGDISTVEQRRTKRARVIRRNRQAEDAASG